MTGRFALTGASIFDGDSHYEASALLVDGAICTGIVPSGSIPADYAEEKLDGGVLTPGFIDLQVNGGGGTLFNQTPTVEGIRTICDAHASFGTTSLLPTLISDMPEITRRAIGAGIQAAQEEVAGFLGLHLEGPHLSIAKKGAHNADYVRPINDGDLEELIDARQKLPNLLVTIAPESVNNEQLSKLKKAGVVVSLGHSDIDAAGAKNAMANGAKCVTHLYNAMSGLDHRQPGLVGATLTTDDVFAGIIADGHHVAPDVINVALKCKSGRGKLFLISDAMPTVGTDLSEFELNGRTILRKDGRLTLRDGTLAGADLELVSAVRFMMNNTDADFYEALRMASLYPARCLGVTLTRGMLGPNYIADIVHLNENQKPKAVWRNGQRFL